MYTKQLTIQNEQGFHVRPAQLFVDAANKFQSDIKVSNESGYEVDGKSILGLMTMGLAKGAVLNIQAEGPDEEAAVLALEELVNSKFGEE